MSLSSTCYVCDCDLPTHRYGLPTHEGLVVPDDWSGPWIGMMVCKRCFDANQNPTEPRLPVLGDAELIGRPT